MRNEQSLNCFLLVATLAFLVSCGDSLNITGITETDETGPEPIGNIDENDWCSNLQDGWALLPAYPNPATENVSFRYNLAFTFRVKLQIINKDKKVVRLLVDGLQQAGNYAVRWDLLNDKGNRVKNGFYRAQLFIDDEFKCQGDVQIKSNN